MKKIYTLLFSAALAFGANAQNLVTNPTFDNGLTGWTAGFTATYTLPTVNATDGSDGSNCAQYTPTATTGFYQDVPVIAGNTIKISFWYKASGDETDARIWSNYKDAAGTIIYQATTSADDPLRNNNGWLATATTWTLNEITVVVPANATTLALAVRAYTNSSVFYDQFSVVDQTLAVKQNQIEGLKVYPNPVTNGTFYINTNANTTKEVVVYDVLGKQVVKTSTTNAVNVSNLKGGVYIVKITEDGKTATRKLVIK
jgi:hypothetical protein